MACLPVHCGGWNVIEVCSHVNHWPNNKSSLLSIKSTVSNGTTTLCLKWLRNMERSGNGDESDWGRTGRSCSRGEVASIRRMPTSEALLPLLCSGILNVELLSRFLIGFACLKNKDFFLCVGLWWVKPEAAWQTESVLVHYPQLHISSFS